MSDRTWLLMGATVAAVTFAGGSAWAQQAPAAAPSLLDQIIAGKPILEIRTRYEAVDQTKSATIKDDAVGTTSRARIGWETGAWNSLKALVEVEAVRSVGPENYAVNVPGATTPPLNGASRSVYPLINDPKVTELNRLQLSWTPNAMMSFTVGRQRILFDDQRFVGNSGWRQDEQTFDGARADVNLGQVKASYAYINRVNRVLGDLRDWDSDSHLLNVVWSPAEALKLQGFVYALDFKNSAINSSITKGAKAFGKTRLGPYRFAYSATYARQSDFRNSPTSFDLDYVAADVAATFDIYTAKLDYEQLNGDGVRGFTTPVGTTHGFQGWADAFVSPGGNKSFVDGIKDTNLTLNAKPRVKMTHLFNPDISVRYHDFLDQRTDADLGHEWDLQGTVSVQPNVMLQLKYADFKRDAVVPAGTATPPPSRTKVWFVVDYHF